MKHSLVYPLWIQGSLYHIENTFKCTSLTYRLTFLALIEVAVETTELLAYKLKAKNTFIIGDKLINKQKNHL